MTKVTAEIDAIIARARKAQQAYETTGNQERFDSAAKAAAWALMEPSRNSELSALAVAETGLGNVDDKITKNHIRRIRPGYGLDPKYYDEVLGKICRISASRGDRVTMKHFALG